MAEKTIFILDSYGLIYRSYYAFIHRPLVNTQGENISAIFGFFRIFYKILKDYKPSYIVAAFDSRIPTFRHEMYKEYKATRQKTPEDLHAQIPVIEEILKSLNIPILRCDGYEADDIIATIAKECKKQNFCYKILTGDKDLMQLVDDKTFILKPDKTGGWQEINEVEVENIWGIKPNQMKDFLSLLGDTADNIPGVKGIGEKTAQKLLVQYETLDGIYEHLNEITGANNKKLTEGKEDAYFSRKLVELCFDVPIDFSLESFCVPNFNYKAASEILFANGANAVAKSFAEQAGISGVKNDTNAKEKKQEIRAFPQFEEESNFSELKENTGNYKAITTEKELESIIDYILEKKYIAFDCETNSLNAHKAKLAGFSFSITKGEGIYVPLVSAESFLLGGATYISEQKAIQELNRLFSCKEMTIITHNGKYDYQVLRANGLEKPKCIFCDTMIASWLLNPERSSHSLESLSETQLGLKTISYQSLFPKNAKEMTFFDLPLEKALPYAAEDADLTLQLWNIFEPKLKELGLLELFSSIEMPILPVLAEMEIEGIHIDKIALKNYGIELSNLIEESKQEIYNLVGHEFNIASTKQLQEVLFTERKLPPSKKTKTGFSTDTAVLEELAALDPVPKKILEYRANAKLLSTYVESIPLLADENDRVHTTFLQTGTATGRLSSKDPNLQNIPVRDEAGRKIRTAFTAKENHILVSADYSQIELVLLAHLSGDKNLQNAFNSGTDVHKATASLIFGIEPNNVIPEMRRTAKTINFGVMYGMSAFRLANELNISRQQAKEFIDTYFATYSGVQDFIQKTIASAEEKGFVETIFGRRRYIKSILSKNKNEKAGAERIAVNTPIQGSAADIVKKAMLFVNQEIQNQNLSAKLLLQVHDELIIECPTNEEEKVITLLKEQMENVISLSVPLKVSVESGKNWGLFH